MTTGGRAPWRTASFCRARGTTLRGPMLTGPGVSSARARHPAFLPAHNALRSAAFGISSALAARLEPPGSRPALCRARRSGRRPTRVDPSRRASIHPRFDLPAFRPCRASTLPCFDLAVLRPCRASTLPCWGPDPCSSRHANAASRRHAFRPARRLPARRLPARRLPARRLPALRTPAAQHACQPARLPTSTPASQHDCQPCGRLPPSTPAAQDRARTPHGCTARPAGPACRPARP
jgi:hypothetical protein